MATTCESPHTFLPTLKTYFCPTLVQPTMESLLLSQLLHTLPSTSIFEKMDIELGYMQVKLSTNMDTPSWQWDTDQVFENVKLLPLT
jgi:hypothetical protein